ncbi:glycosyltransferase family 4 protein [Anabaena sp. FACHB-1250]|uniref:glycosyltransferase n=1 Tax=unclassified Anabaena TaxID=2619674 RepID=UPI00168070EC|nr:MULTISPECIES: glycosyltransferase [unclassified Anabaena]MBD2141677.1 glycosyltransferase family 4 protein [Anabaena sp. FACHB-1250]MBD2267611.1 glycosyltransferase family 4 protein [Anabaena sp. FACHB-1391]
MTNSSSIRILFVSHTYVVGINQGKLNAIASLSSRRCANSVGIAEIDDIEVGLLTPSNWKALEWNRHIPLETPYPHIRTYSAPVLFSGRGGAHIYPPWKIWQVLNVFRPDIVQVEEEVFSLCAYQFALWSRFTGKPLVIFGWENIDRQLSLPRRWICQFVLNTASAIISGNHDGAEIMCRWGYKGLLTVMPQMGVDPEFFAPCPHRITRGDSEALLQAVRPFQIGFLGRLTHSKGIDLIFAAAHQLREQGFNFRILICGSGQHEAELNQISQEQEVADWVIWQGAVRHEQAPEMISQFDVLVLPSRTTPEWKEQFGHVLIEAMAMGVPVVGSNSGEIPNVIGREDLIFREENTQELAAILARLISEPQWCQEISNYCIHRVNQLYSHERIASRLNILWQKVLGQKNSELVLN